MEPVIGSMTLQEQSWYIESMDLSSDDQGDHACTRRATAFLSAVFRTRWAKTIRWLQPSWVAKMCNGDEREARKRVQRLFHGLSVNQLHSLKLGKVPGIRYEKAKEVTTTCGTRAGGTIEVSFRMLFERTGENDHGSWYVAPLSIACRPPL